MICVSRYNEDLAWTLEFPFNQFNYIVYNKGVNDLFEKKNVSKVIPIPNVGRCDQTYLYHVVSNYNDLSDIVIFFPGSINMENKKKIAIKLLLNIMTKKKASFIGGETKSIFHLFNNFSQDEYCCQNPINQELNSESKLFLCPQRPFGNWVLQHGFIDVNQYCFYGVFSIDKRDIYQHPISRYVQLLQELSVHSNPEVGHYTERAWASIFGPFKHTSFEKCTLPIYENHLPLEKKRNKKRVIDPRFIYK
jgi:hypothetical protein